MTVRDLLALPGVGLLVLMLVACAGVAALTSGGSADGAATRTPPPTALAPLEPMPPTDPARAPRPPLRR